MIFNKRSINMALAVLFLLAGIASAEGEWAANGDTIHNTNTGNVGIGTTNPQQTLDVNGGFTIGHSSRWAMHENLQWLEDNKEYILRIPWFNDSNYRTFGFTVTVYGSPVSSVNPHGYVRHYFAGYKVQSTNKIVIQGNYAVDLQGNIPNQISFHNLSYNPGFIDINFATYGGYGSGRWCTFIIEFYRNAYRAAAGFTITSDGPRSVSYAREKEKLQIGGGYNVGIGTTNPGAKLDVRGPNTGSGLLRIHNTGSSAGDVNGIDFYHYTDETIVTNPKAYIRDEVLANRGTKLHFGTSNNTGSTEVANTKMTIDDLGNVGIGTTNPQQTLDVNGGFTIGHSSRWAMHENLQWLEDNKEYILRIPWFNDSNYRTFGFTVTVYGSPVSSVNPHGYVRHYFAGYKVQSTNKIVIQGNYAVDLQGNIPNQISFHNLSYNPGFIDINFATYGGYGSGRWCTFIIEFYRNAYRAAAGFTITSDGPRSVSYAREKEKLQIGGGYNVGIGTTSPQSKLAVNGTITAKEIKVESGWSDFVFDDDYNLASLDEVASFIRENKHLPDIPPARDVAQQGVAVSEMLAKQMQKIEELTLYLINIKKENDHLKATIDSQNKQLCELDELRKRIEALELKN